MFESPLSKEFKNKRGFLGLQKGLAPIFIILIIVLGIGVISGTYGAIEYHKTSKLVKEAEQLTMEEKYNEANEKLELAQNKWFTKNLGVKKQEITNEIEKNKKLLEDKSEEAEKVADEARKKAEEEEVEEKPIKISEEPKITCQNECSQIGSKKCSNNGYQICGNYDEDDCLEWSSITNCPTNSVCQNGDCVSVPIVQCSSGPCCDISTKKFKPATYKCQENIKNEYGCPWGSSTGNDVGIRYQHRYCSGSSANCDGALKWGDWVIYKDCALNEACVNGVCTPLTRQLTGTKTLKLLVVEFVPQDIKYGKLYYCYNNLLGYYFQDLEEYCDNKIEEHSFLEITNNPQKQFRFENLREVDRLYNPHSLFYLNDYLKKEAGRYGVTEIPYFNIEIKGPFSLSELPPKTTFDYGNVDDFFINKVKELNIDTSNYDFVAVIYFNDDLLSKIDRHKFVNHAGNWIFISLDTCRVTQDHGVDILIHELLHKFGATDKYIFGESDPNDWCYLFECCLEPDGIPEPNKVPKYPQTKGCIMCAGGMIAIQYGKESQAPGSLDRVVICDKTAEEIGWK